MSGRCTLDRTSTAWRDAVRRAVEEAPPLDDATRVRLRGVFAGPGAQAALPPGAVPAAGERTEVAA